MKKVWYVMEKELFEFLSRKTNYGYLFLPVIYVALSWAYMPSGGSPFFFTFILFFSGLIAISLPIGLATRTILEERLRNVIEPLLAAPITGGEIVLGKILPIILVSLTVTLSTILPVSIILGLSVPIVSLLALTIAIMMTSFAGTCIGVIISIKSRTMQDSGLLTFVSFFLFLLPMFISADFLGSASFMLYLSPTFYLKQIFITFLTQNHANSDMLILELEPSLSPDISFLGLIVTTLSLFFLTVKLFDWEDLI